MSYRMYAFMNREGYYQLLLVGITQGGHAIEMKSEEFTIGSFSGILSAIQFWKEVWDVKEYLPTYHLE